MRGGKAVLGGAALLVAAVLVGVGVFAAFSDTEATNVNVRAGALDIAGAQDITVAGIAPGDISLRDLSVAIPDADNEGNLVQAIRVSVPPPAAGNDVVGAPTDAGDQADIPAGASLLSGAQGLRVVLASCSGAWTLPPAGAALGSDGNGDGLDDSAVCAGTSTVTQSEVPLSDLVGADTFEYEPGDFGLTPTPTGTFPDGSTLNVIAQLRLPAEADNAYENASLTFDLVFEAVQRAGTNR